MSAKHPAELPTKGLYTLYTSTSRDGERVYTLLDEEGSLIIYTRNIHLIKATVARGETRIQVISNKRA